MKNKLNAFTLFETLITLMLISVILGMSYALINLLQKQLITFEKENFELIEYNQFNTAILRDIHRSESGKIINDTNLEVSYYYGSTIKYSVKKDYILRESNLITIDTFFVKTIPYKSDVLEDSSMRSKVFSPKLRVLLDTVQTHYRIKLNKANLINKEIFYED